MRPAAASFSKPDAMGAAGYGVGDLQGVLVEFPGDDPAAQKHGETRYRHADQDVLRRGGFESGFGAGDQQDRLHGKPRQRQQGQQPVATAAEQYGGETEKGHHAKARSPVAWAGQR